MIDLHCHLLPGIDDGPADLGGTLAMARLHVEAGVRTVAATPHVSWDMPTDAATIDLRLGDVRAALAAAKIPLEVVRGAELDVHQAIGLSDEQLRALALGGGPWLLLEAPLTKRVALAPVAHALLDRGHRVLLAHPERSPLLQRDPEALRALVHAGAATQVTAGSFAGSFGRTVQGYAEQMLEAGLVHSVASDAHDARRRPPGIAEPMAAAGLGELTPLLAQEAPAAILAGDPLPSAPAWRRRRRSPLRTLLGRR
ncbi:MAG TPA: CpsB/CapC family capsule biosynthesis tyrosine phosphatase [Conexibacter sp.]|nr:CpsB/CapC family capsule biosynthesis tyrosine phosphatase [Conexibacter sp.]